MYQFLIAISAYINTMTSNIPRQLETEDTAQLPKPFSGVVSIEIGSKDHHSSGILKMPVCRSRLQYNLRNVASCL